MFLIKVESFKNENKSEKEVELMLREIFPKDKEEYNIKLKENNKYTMDFSIYGSEYSNILNKKIKDREDFISNINSLLKTIDEIRDFNSKTIKKLTETKKKEIPSISIDDAKKLYPKTNNLTIGTYTIHPKSNKKLVKVESFHKNLALEKNDELIVLLGRMGAKRIIISNNSKSQSNCGIEIDTIISRLDLSINKSDSKSHQLIVDFEGNDVVIEDDLLENSLWFSDDSQLNSIFEGRKFRKNKIKKYMVKLNYYDSFDFDFELAKNILKFQIDLESNFNTIRENETLFEVEFN